ncbi:MAG: TolC family protein [Treponema sp.]|jgi:outer membrane protein TolC|nr:TolC family protein [Treponema sp.]
MKKIILFILLAAGTFILPALVFAQAQTLSLEQARGLALQNSRSLAQSNLAIQSRLLDEKTQSYSNYPSLSLGAQAGTTLFDWKEGTSKDILKDNLFFGANAGVSQRLWDFDAGKTSIQKAIASLSTESARQDALAEYYNVLNTVDSAYYAVLEAQAGLEASENSLETANLSLSIAEIRRQSKMLSEADYLKALADKESRETSRNQSRRDLSIAWLKLNNILGIKSPVELEPVDFGSFERLIQTLAKMDDTGFEKLHVRFWKSIMQRNPGLIKAGINSNAAEKSLDTAKRDYSPSLGASVSTGISYNYKNNNLDNGLKPAPVRLSLTASVPLDFWATSANIEKRKIALNQSAMNYLGAMESADIDLQVCLLNLISNAGQILSSSRALDYARMNFDHVLELYRMGQGSQSALSDAELSLRNSRNQSDRTRYSFLSALSSLRSLGAFDSGEEIKILLAELGLQ